MSNETGHVLIAGGGVAALEAALALASAGRRSRVASNSSLRSPTSGTGRSRSRSRSGSARCAASSCRPGGRGRCHVHARRARRRSTSGADLRTPRRVAPLPYARCSSPAARPETGGHGRDHVPRAGGHGADRGAADGDRAGEVRRVAFVVPAGRGVDPSRLRAGADDGGLARRARHRRCGARRSSRPRTSRCICSAASASDAVRALLDERGIAVHTGAYAAEAARGAPPRRRTGIIPADRVVALPRLQGPRIGGVPQTFEGFVPVDAHGRVDRDRGRLRRRRHHDLSRQAGRHRRAAGRGRRRGDRGRGRRRRDAARLSGRFSAGCSSPAAEPRYLRGELAAARARPRRRASEPLWWPPAKIVGRYLAPFLAAARRDRGAARADAAALGRAVEVELEPSAEQRRDRLVEAGSTALEPTASTVGDVMADDPLVVAPEDTLGEVAERMLRA